MKYVRYSGLLLMSGILLLCSACSKPQDSVSSLLVNLVYNGTTMQVGSVNVTNDTTGNKKLTFSATLGIDASGQAYFPNLTAGTYLVSATAYYNYETVRGDTSVTVRISDFHQLTLMLH